jgi:hypothetical protein
MDRKNKTQGRKMTMQQIYNEIMEMLASARSNYVAGKEDKANLLLFDALQEYKIYKEKFKAKGMPILAMEQSFEDTRRTLGLKETNQ